MLSRLRTQPLRGVTYLGPHDVRVCVRHEANDQTRLTQRRFRVPSEAETLENLWLVDDGLTAGTGERSSVFAGRVVR